MHELILFLWYANFPVWLSGLFFWITNLPPTKIPEKALWTPTRAPAIETGPPSQGVITDIHHDMPFGTYSGGTSYTIKIEDGLSNSYYYRVEGPLNVDSHIGDYVNIVGFRSPIRELSFSNPYTGSNSVSIGYGAGPYRGNLVEEVDW